MEQESNGALGVIRVGSSQPDGVVQRHAEYAAVPGTAVDRRWARVGVALARHAAAAPSVAPRVYQTSIMPKQHHNRSRHCVSRLPVNVLER